MFSHKCVLKIQSGINAFLSYEIIQMKYLNPEWKQFVQGRFDQCSQEKLSEKTFQSCKDLYDGSRYTMNSFYAIMWDAYSFNLLFEVSLYIFIICNIEELYIVH